ncbi:MAG: hypothetical protein ACRENP_14965 [Longimicrobiales bacterium]
MRKLVLELRNGLSESEFVQGVVKLVEAGVGVGTHWIDEAVLAVLVRHDCSEVLLGEVRDICDQTARFGL